MKYLPLLLVPALLLAVPSRADPPKQWTLLVYLNGDNDLWDAAVTDLNEMETIGSSAQVNVVVQVDLPRAAYGRPPFDDTRRYYVLRDDAGMNDAIVSTQVWPETGTRELDMGDPATLSEFAAWGIDAYPAEKYALVIWDHGDGWKGVDLVGGRGPLAKEISSDYSSGSSISVAGGELAAALAAVAAHRGTARAVDLLGFDACLMGTWEVDYVVAPYAAYVMQSEESAASTGFDYAAFISAMVSSPSADAATVCDRNVEVSIDSVGSTLSCVDLTRLGVLNDAIDALAGALIGAAETHEAQVTAAADATLRFSDETLADLGHLAALLAADATLPAAVTGAAQALVGTVDSVVGRNETRGPYHDARGVSIYLPIAAPPLPYDTDYTESAGATWTERMWDDMLCSFSEMVCGPDAWEPDDTAAQASAIAADGAAQRHNFFPLGDTDFATFDAVEGIDYVVSTTGRMDTYLWLLASDGETVIARDDDDGEGKNALVEWTGDRSGKVYLKVQHYGTYAGWGAETGRYDLVVQGEACDPLAPPACKELGVCAGTRRACEGDAWTCPYPEGYRETDDSCDGADSDCDGATDEDYAPSRCGLGECQVESACAGGVETCTPRAPAAASDTTCDGKDEDCDGQVDEDADCAGCDPADRPACLDAGVCAGTAPVCESEAWRCPYPATYAETDDSCDRLDNNCDGVTDEDAVCPYSVGGSGLACSVAAVR